MIYQSSQLLEHPSVINGQSRTQPAPTILFVVSSLEVGGIETYLLRFLRYAGDAINATVLCKSGRGGALEAEYREVGAKLSFLKLGTSISKRYLNLFQMLRRGRWDGICDFTGDFAGLVLLTARLAGVQTRLAFYRGSQYQFRPTPLRIAFARFLGWLVRINASRILSNSQVALNWFHPRWTKQHRRYLVIRNPAPNPAPMPADKRAELRHAAGIPDQAVLIVHVGRVATAKNHETVLSVVRTVLERHGDVWGVLIGLGTSDFCESRVPPHIATRLRTFEHRSDVIDFLQASDLFLFPSLNEGMPNAMIEAMAAGCPVVASDIPAIKEVFPPAYSSYLFAPTDVAGGVERIERLMSRSDPRYGQRLAEWVRQNFGLEETFGAFLTELGGSNSNAGDVHQ